MKEDRHMGTNETVYCFAYGSNMLSRRVKTKDRAPSAEVFRTGFVQNRRITFDKLGSDGSGKCDIEDTDKSTDRAYGVVFRLPAKEEANLDRAEGLGKGYRKEQVKVITPEGKCEAFTYVATRKDASAQPYHWYKALVIAGAVEHGLPAAYVEWLRTFTSKPDPDSKRRAENEAILFSIW
jgi:cation transport regulator ChaC